VPPELDAICLRALARRRDERIPRAAELARELGRILHQRNPGYGREDFGALVSERVPPLPPVEIPPEAANPPTAIDAAAHRQLDLETRSVAPSQRHRRWRRLSASAWLGVFFGVIIVVSMTIVVFRVLLPGTDEPIAVVPDAAPPDAAPRAPDAGGDLGTPFTLVPRATADEERVLGEAVRGWDVARRGTPTDDYTTFLSALDHRIALLQLDGAGRPMAPAPLPPTLIVRLGPNLGAVDAVMRYVEATGKLPRGVADALRSFLANYPAFVRAETLAVGVRLPAYSAAALSVWLSPKDPRRLAVLAVANEWLGRWCEPIGVPTSRWFAPVLCDRDTLLAALPPGDATAAAFARWDAALDEATVGGVTLRARDPEQSAGDRSGEDILSLVVETVPDASYALVAGVLPGERAPRTQAAEGAVTRLSFRVPPAIFKPVLIVRHAGETFELRIGRPR
jgi:hypothetical protein